MKSCRVPQAGHSSNVMKHAPAPEYQKNEVLVSLVGRCPNWRIDDRCSHAYACSGRIEFEGRSTLFCNSNGLALADSGHFRVLDFGDVIGGSFLFLIGNSVRASFSMAIDPNV